MKANLEWFRTFKTLFEIGNMSEAARELNISQPAVSLHVNSLEAFLGYRLFERNTRRLLPTEQAKVLYAQVRLAVDKLENVENSFCKKVGSDRKTVSVGFFFGLFKQLLRSHISRLGFNVIVHLSENERLVELLEQGSVDFIVTTDRISRHNVVTEKIGESHFILVAGRETSDEVIEVLNRLNTSEMHHLLETQTWYNTHDYSKLNEFWQMNFNHIPDFAPNFIVPDKISILKCLADSDGFAVLPESLCRPAIESGEIKWHWPGVRPLTNSIYLAHRKNKLLEDELETLKQIVKAEYNATH